MFTHAGGACCPGCADGASARKACGPSMFIYSNEPLNLGRPALFASQTMRNFHDELILRAIQCSTAVFSGRSSTLADPSPQAAKPLSSAPRPQEFLCLALLGSLMSPSGKHVKTL